MKEGGKFMDAMRVHHQKGSTGVEVAIAPQISCNRTNCN
jgi:hypothetical protein